MRLELGIGMQAKQNSSAVFTHIILRTIRIVYYRIFCFVVVVVIGPFSLEAPKTTARAGQGGEQQQRIGGTGLAIPSTWHPFDDDDGCDFVLC